MKSHRASYTHDAKKSRPYQRPSYEKREPQRQPRNWTEWKAGKDLPAPQPPQLQVKPRDPAVLKPLSSSFVKKDMLFIKPPETSNGAQSNTGASSTPTTPTVSIKQAHGSGAPSASNLRVSSGYKAVNQSSPSAKAPGSTSASLQTANPTVTNTKITPKVSVAGSVNSAPVVTGGVSTPAAPPQITAIPGANNQTLPQSAGPAFFSGITGGKAGGKGKARGKGAATEGQPHFTCTVCKCTVSSELTLEAHLKGKKHIKEYETAVHRRQIQPVSDPQSYVVLSDDSPGPPYTGIPVQRVEMPAPKPPPRREFVKPIRLGPSISELYCGVCEVSATSAQTIVDHINGKKHQKREVHFRGIDPNPTSRRRDRLLQYSCDVCGVVFAGSETMRMHIAGAKHLSMCRRIAVGPEYLVAKGKWAVPADDWQNFSAKEMERKRRPKDDGGWGAIRDTERRPVDRSRAFVAPLTVSGPRPFEHIDPWLDPTPSGSVERTADGDEDGDAAGESGSGAPAGFFDYTRDVFF